MGSGEAANTHRSKRRRTDEVQIDDFERTEVVGLCEAKLRDEEGSQSSSLCSPTTQVSRRPHLGTVYMEPSTWPAEKHTQPKKLPASGNDEELIAAERRSSRGIDNERTTQSSRTPLEKEQEDSTHFHPVSDSIESVLETCLPTALDSQHARALDTATMPSLGIAEVPSNNLNHLDELALPVSSTHLVSRQHPGHSQLSSPTNVSPGTAGSRGQDDQKIGDKEMSYSSSIPINSTKTPVGLKGATRKGSQVDLDPVSDKTMKRKLNGQNAAMRDHVQIREAVPSSTGAPIQVLSGSEPKRHSDHSGQERHGREPSGVEIPEGTSHRSKRLKLCSTFEFSQEQREFRDPSELARQLKEDFLKDVRRSSAPELDALRISNTTDVKRNQASHSFHLLHRRHGSHGILEPVLAMARLQKGLPKAERQILAIKLTVILENPTT